MLELLNCLRCQKVSDQIMHASLLPVWEGNAGALFTWSRLSSYGTEVKVRLH